MNEFLAAAHSTKRTRRARLIAILPLVAILAGCAIGTAPGPSTRAIIQSDVKIGDSGIQLVDVTDSVARRLVASRPSDMFSDTFGESLPAGSVLGAGDMVAITIWEAPPAALFANAVSSSSANLASTAGGGGLTLPDQMINSGGTVSIPFAGAVRAAGRTTSQIAADIVRKLEGKAHQPQVIVRVSRNATSAVTIVGEVANSTRMPLTAQGERLLDALATAGGVRQPVGKMTLQLTRGELVRSMPLEAVIKDPRQNITLQSGDVVTALFQPFSFTALGATGRNEEINFEATGVTLAQALGRVGGLQDYRADPRGVFLFRLEDPAALDLPVGTVVKTTPDGKVPVIYRVDLKDPGTFFVAQGFPIRNKDVLYVTNAPIVDLQRFVGIVSSLAYTAIGVTSVTK